MKYVYILQLDTSEKCEIEWVWLEGEGERNYGWDSSV